MPSFDGGDDFVGVLGPGKGLWLCIGVVEEAVDGIFEFLHGLEHATLEALLCEVGEEALDGIEPRGGCRGKMEHEARMFVDPFQDLGMLVGRIIIDDDMDCRLLRHPGIDDIEEADEFLMAMALHTLADDLAFQYIKRRKQCRDAVTLVVVGNGAGTSLLHRQPRLGAVECLDLAHMGICGSRCSDRITS